MKKNLLLIAVFLLFIVTATFAQSSTTVETPRNYKPHPKELLPMPGELTDEMIFPVLGKYEYTDNDGNVSNITISRDADNKGTVWINGMPQGKFKADLKASPATYKIPAQKTLQNDVEEDLTTATTDSTVSDVKPEKAARFSGKSLKEGTLILDSLTSKLYINVGAKFNQDDPSSVFPEMVEVAETTDSTMVTEDAAEDVKKVDKKKKPKITGTTYILTKLVNDATVTPVEEEKDDDNQ